MTIKYNYLFIYNQPSVWQTWKYFSKQQLPTNDATSLLCYCHHLHRHNTQTCEQFCHNLCGASTYIFAKYSRSCKYFLVEKSDHRGRCSALALDCVHACAGWAWPSWGGAPAARKAECLSQGELSWVQLCYHTSHQGDCPQPRKCRLRHISTRHRHLRLVTSKARPAPSILMRMETDTSKCWTL